MRSVAKSHAAAIRSYSADTTWGSWAPLLVQRSRKAAEFWDLSARKERMVELSDAFISLPGGLGTFDEFFSVISRVKAGEIEAKSALFDVDDFFAQLAELLDNATARGLNSTDWRAHCGLFGNAQELLDWIEA